jgi:hypothetical protein
MARSPRLTEGRRLGLLRFHGLGLEGSQVFQISSAHARDRMSGVWCFLTTLTLPLSLR